MFKIGEFSVLSSISIHMLRNYDKIGLLEHKVCDYTCMWNGIEDLYQRKSGEEVPDKKAEIPLSNSIFSIIFTTIFCIILYTAPEVFAVYIRSGNEIIGIPIFNLEVLQGYRVLIMSILILSIFKEMMKIYYRRWMLKLSVINVILTVITTVLVLIILTDNSVWNPNFITGIIKHFNLTFDFASLLERIKRWVVAVIVLATSIEIISVLYKGICYDTKK